MEEVEIDWIGGNCPVQSEGTISGKRYYFRARGDGWSLQVSPAAAAGCTYLSWPYSKDEWSYQEAFGKDFEAGWMEEDTARQMIFKAAGIYLKEQKGSEI